MTRDDDELVWTLFTIRVSICESEGAERDALERREQELIEELSDVLDPRVHVNLPHAPVPSQPSVF
jgi:hypothetical protein